MLMRLKQS